MDKISAAPITGTLSVGDKITGPALPDRRSWWRRTAPKWLGGQDAPQPINAVIVATAEGGRWR